MPSPPYFFAENVVFSNSLLHFFAENVVFLTLQPPPPRYKDAPTPLHISMIFVIDAYQMLRHNPQKAGISTWCCLKPLKIHFTEDGKRQ